MRQPPSAVVGMLQPKSDELGQWAVGHALAKPSQKAVVRYAIEEILYIRVYDPGRSCAAQRSNPAHCLLHRAAWPVAEACILEFGVEAWSESLGYRSLRDPVYNGWDGKAPFATGRFWNIDLSRQRGEIAAGTQVIGQVGQSPICSARKVVDRHAVAAGSASIGAYTIPRVLQGWERYRLPKGGSIINQR